MVPAHLPRRAAAGVMVLACLVATAGCGGGSADPGPTASGSSRSSGVPTSSAPGPTRSTPPPTGAGSTSASTAVPATCKQARFAVHVGLAAGTIRRYLLKPVKTGQFAPTAKHRAASITKAVLAGAFVQREFSTAARDLQGCPSAAVLSAPLQAGSATISSMQRSIGSGTVDEKSINALLAQVVKIETAAATQGIRIVEQEPTPELLASGKTGE